MSEERIIELLTKKFAGEATPEEADELHQLLSASPENRSLQETFREIWGYQVPLENTDVFYQRHKEKYADLFAEMQPAAASETARPEEHSAPVLPLTAKRTKWIRYAAAAIVLTVFAVASSLLFLRQRPSEEGPQFVELVAGKGVRKAVTLPDGTKVWLNSDSKLYYDANITGSKMRLVTLSGEAFFDVAHDKQRPFIISTDKVSIKVLGTAFNVKAYKNDKKYETTLIRGSIELTVNDATQQKFLLKPSEKFALISNNQDANGKSRGDSGATTLLIEHINTVMLANKTYVQETSWTDDRLIFDNETLEELAVKLERWYNVKIQILSPKISKYHFTGAFTNETIEQALTALQYIKSFNFKINADEITIY